MIYRIKILSEDYRREISYIVVMVIFRKKLINFKIPYWIKRSKLTDEVIREIDGAVTKLNRE